MFILQEEYDEESHRCMVSKVLFPTTSHVSQVFGKDQMIGNQHNKDLNRIERPQSSLS